MITAQHTRRTALTRTAGAVSAAAVLTLTAACGSSTSTATSSSSSSGGSSSSASGGTASAAQLTTSNIFSSITAAQKKAGSYSFSLSATAAGTTTNGTGQADVSGAQPQLKSSIKAMGQSIQTIATGGLFYVKAAALSGGKWIKIDPKDKSGLGALFGSADPAQQLKVLDGAAKVTKGDTEQVDGVSTTEYVVTVPSSALAKSSPTLKQLASALPKTIEYDIYVDKDNLLRKLDNELTVSGHKVDTEVTFSDYGKAVSVSAPPASQTTTAPKTGGFGLGGTTASS